MLGRMNPVVETQMATGIGPEVFSESESFYRTALESLSEGVLILDAECRIVYANKLVCEITGYSPEDFRGKPRSWSRPTGNGWTAWMTRAPLNRRKASRL